MKDMLRISGRDHSFAAKCNSARLARRRPRERGAVAVMSTALLIVIIGFFALALDMSRIYNRRAEMHTLADSAALAAARHLNGTEEGIEDALAAAKEIIEDRANGPKYDYNNGVTWSDAAMTFASSPDGDGGWKSAGEAAASPAGLMYARVDTHVLGDEYGRVTMLFAPVLSSTLGSVSVSHTAVAGKSRLGVTPLAICAMSTTPHSKRTHPSGAAYDELMEYGFRRGVGYNLLNLNPAGTTAAHFQVNPVALAGSSSDTHYAAAIYDPYICSGTMAVPRVTGASIAIRAGFPIGTYLNRLNSRFDPYTAGVCNVHTAPPDSNVKQYTFGSTSWMAPKALHQSARRDLTATDRLQTVAEFGPANHAVATDYGPLWSFARAVPWSAYEEQGSPEPPTGYRSFDATTAVWKALYSTDSGVGTYPDTTPYRQKSDTNYLLGPTTLARKPGAANRRVLNIPLLSCPVTGSSATVLAIGRFFMTVPADATSIHAEFGGIASDDRLGGLVEIYR